MILVYPNNEYDLRVMRDWCREQFGVRDRYGKPQQWGIIQPEFIFAFNQEEWATAFILKFGGKVYER